MTGMTWILPVPGERSFIRWVFGILVQLYFFMIVKTEQKTIYLLTELHPGASYGCCSYHLGKQFH